ncbi:MAG: TonB-dependent receptor [gamma proteobacterium symbiont of Taylorina sp.]|nr:TonB-dependent receptor [gamma proteobacterium symbiont of Taylorina sp.]
MKNLRAFFLSCLLSATVLPHSTYAAHSTDDLLHLSFEQLTQVKVIIATGIEQDIHKAPAAVTLITADDIKKTGATNLVEVLEGVPGVHIKTDSFGNRPLVHIRGGNSHQTLLMINGTPVKDLVWASGIFWKGLPVNSIERVEVIRGPGSALYGADASSGVINVITKTAGKIEGSETGIRVGSFDTQAAWIQSGGDWNGFELGITADFSSTDGHQPDIPADREGNSGKVGYGWKNSDVRISVARENWHFLASYARHDDIETGMTGAGYFDPVTEGSDERYDLDLLYDNKNFSSDWGLNAKLHYQDLDYTSGDGFQETPPSDDYPDGRLNHMSSAERQLHFEGSGLYSRIDKHSIRIGAGYKWQDLYHIEQQVNYLDSNADPLSSAGSLIDISNTPYAFAPETDRTIQYVFLQDVWTIIEDWELTAGVRYDHYSDFGSTINPRLALIWETTDKLTTKLMYGEAFRAPSFQELYADTSRAKSNPDLEAEKSETIELAFSYNATKNINFALNIFNFETSDSISRDSNRQYQNTGDHKTFGIEIEAVWQASRDVKLSANYTHRDPDNTELRVVEEPEQEAYLRSDWQFSHGWNWNIQANWVAERIRAENDSRSNIDNYVIADTTLRYSGLKQWEFAASIRNLLDEDAHEHASQSIPDDFPLAERNIYAEVRYKF